MQSNAPEEGLSEDVAQHEGFYARGQIGVYSVFAEEFVVLSQNSSLLQQRDSKQRTSMW
jgi:hypothetical protein